MRQCLSWISRRPVGLSLTPARAGSHQSHQTGLSVAAQAAPAQQCSAGKSSSSASRFLDQALDRLVVFDAPGFDEGIERGECIPLGLGHPDLLQRPLGFRLLPPGFNPGVVQDVGGLVRPAALSARLGPHFLDRLPEAERASAPANSALPQVRAASGRGAAPSRIAHSRAHRRSGRRAPSCPQA
jgi:hypothetical protein